MKLGIHKSDLVCSAGLGGHDIENKFCSQAKSVNEAIFTPLKE
jgi:hypothetical protein